MNENIDLTEYGITLDAKLKEAEGKAVEQYAGEFLRGAKRRAEKAAKQLGTR